LFRRDLVKVKDLVEVGLLYVGVPAVTLYPLGFVGTFVQMWRDEFFPYYDFNIVWNAVAMVPNTVVVGRAYSSCTSPWSPPYWAWASLR